MGVRSLRIGEARYYFTIDSVMWVGKSSIADLYLSCSEKRLQKAVRAGLQATHASMALSKDTAILGKYVDAILLPSNPDNFKVVEQYKNNSRLVDSTSLLTWSWSIVPQKKAYVETFYLILYYSDHPFKDPVESASEINREWYRVQVNLQQTSFFKSVIDFIGREWKWFATSIIIPVFLFWYNSKKKVKQEKTPKK